MDIRKLTQRHIKRVFLTEREDLGRKIWEELAIILHIFRWTFLAGIVGILSGFGTALFLSLLGHGTSITEFAPVWLIIAFPPIGGLIAGLTIYYLSPQSAGHGTEAVIRAVHKHDGEIPLSVPPVKMGASVLSILSGFSVGKEGPCAQIGAGLASFFSWCFNLSPQERRKVVICGISGGFAAVFGTPIAGALFGVEVLFLGQIMYEVLYPCFVSGLVGYETAKMLGVSYDFHDWVLPSFAEVATSDILYFVLAGMIFGLISLVFIESLRFFSRLFRKFSIWPPLKPLVGGAIISMLGYGLYILGDTHFTFFGLGTASIGQAVTGNGKLIIFGAAAVFLKILFTSVSLGSGASGGVVTPIFFIGSTSGIFVSKIFPFLNPTLLCQLGLTAALAACANTPISASVMALELYGPKFGWLAALTAVIAFLVVGHRSVYETQILGLRKTEALTVVSGKEVGGVSGLRLSHSMVWNLGKILHIWRKLRKR